MRYGYAPGPDENDRSTEVEIAIEKRAEEIKADMLKYPGYLVENLTQADDYEELGEALIDLLNAKQGLYYHARQTLFKLEKAIDSASYNMAENEVTRNL